MMQFAALQPGDTIAIVSPSGWVQPDVLEALAAEIIHAGYTPFIHPQCHLQQGSFAGNDEQRLAALHEVYANKQVKAILCARGGYGVPRLVNGLDLDLVARNPKPYIGYSDQTPVLNVIAQQVGHPALLGPMGWSLKNLDQPATWAQLWKLLKGEAIMPTDHPAMAQARVLVPGEAQGPLYGGNLTLISTRMGTPQQLRPEGAIMIIEDVGETLYKLDRMLMQLKDAGFFQQVRGLIIGELAGCADETDGFKLEESVDTFLARWFGGLGGPVVTNFPCGHGKEHAVMPLGVPVRLAADSQGIEITHPPLFV